MNNVNGENCRYVITVTKHTCTNRRGFLGLRQIAEVDEDQIYTQVCRKINLKKIAEAVLSSLPDGDSDAGLAPFALLATNCNENEKKVATK